MALTYFDADELKGFVARLDAEGFQVHFHAIGDRGVREVLDAVEAPAAAGTTGTTWRTCRWCTRTTSRGSGRWG